MDPFSRRSTWEVIKAHKQGHVILFTTHFMDEADLLGDRVAIMSEGRLRCCGSSMFLKARFGLGYRLALSKEVGSQHDDKQLREIVMKYAPGAQVQSDQGAELSYQLPKEGVDFPSLFTELDCMRNGEGGCLDSWGVSMTTLEEVFLKIAHEDHAESHQATKDTEFGRGAVGERGEATVSFMLHFRAVFCKRFYTAWRDKFNMVIQIVIPLLFVFFACMAIEFGRFNISESVDLDAGQFNSPLNIPYTCTSSVSDAADATTTTTNCPATYSTGIAGVGTAATTTTGTDVATKPASTSWDCSDYVDTQQLGFARGDDSSQPELYITPVGGLYYIDEYKYTVSASCAKGMSNDTCAAVVPTVYKCNDGANGTSTISEMASYLFDNMGTSGADSTEKSRYGAISFHHDTTLASSNYQLSSNPYVVLANGSATTGYLTFANMANNLILRQNTGSSTATISVSLSPGPQTAAETGQSKLNTTIVLAFFLIIAFSIVPASFIYSVVAEVVVKVSPCADLSVASHYMLFCRQNTSS